MFAQRTVKVNNPLGLHVRPATELAEKANRFASDISVAPEGGAPVNAKSAIDLLSMAAVVGTVLTIRADGHDAEEAVRILGQEYEEKLGRE